MANVLEDEITGSGDKGVASLTEFASLCEALAATTKKLEKRDLIAKWLRALNAEDAALAPLYLAGTPFAETDGRGLNIGGSLLSKTIGEVSEADAGAMHAAYLRHGDLGAAAYDLLQERDRRWPARPAEDTLTLKAVSGAFDELAAASKPAAKLSLLLALLSRATPLEAKYLIKLVLGDMRTGVKQSLVEEAIASAYEVESSQVRRASMLAGSLPEVVRMARTGMLDQARMKLFHPIGFMLASPVDSVDEALARFAQEIAAEIAGAEPGASGGVAKPGKTEAPTLPSARPFGEAANAVAPGIAIQEAQMEDKYDGIRAQLHAGDPMQPGRVALFSRSRDDMTASFPEIVAALSPLDKPAILDGEILAWDPAAGRALPFSSLQQRVGRKRISEEMKRQTPVVFMAFDAMYLDGALLIEQPLSERRAALEKFVAFYRTGWGKKGSRTSSSDAAQQPELFGDILAASEGKGTETDFPRLVLAPAVRLENAEQLEQAYSDARARGNEGVMLKALHSIYQPGRRGLAWLKLKRELATLDVVVTAVEYGHGRRAKVLSDYTFAVLDGGELKNVGKAYSGLTDAEINEYTAFFLEHTLKDYGRVRSVEPFLVLEVAFNNVMRSDRHASGFALRFPRILRIRTDKLAGDIDTLARVEEIYNSQPDRPVES